jgi:2-amino-4-hydroxy-6-hydroxymethyldihydropteridine diphosphokinase
MSHIVYIGIGSNLGDKVGQCERAIAEILKVDQHKLLAKSSLFKTKPIGDTSQDWFVNAVIKIETDLEPLELLQVLQEVEFRLGRKKTYPWGPRTIDLDILFYDEEEVQLEDLQIPHPLLHQRQFVLVPLTEIDRGFIHPVLKKSIGELLEDLKENQGVKRLQPSCWKREGN